MTDLKKLKHDSVHLIEYIGWENFKDSKFSSSTTDNKDRLTNTSWSSGAARKLNMMSLVMSLYSKGLTSPIVSDFLFPLLLELTTVYRRFNVVVIWFIMRRRNVWMVVSEMLAAVGRPPLTILTYQYAAMANATMHFLQIDNQGICVWHIAGKFAKQFDTLVKERFQSFVKFINYIALYTNSVMKMVCKWKFLLLEYDLSSNVHLNSL